SATLFDAGPACCTRGAQVVITNAVWLHCHSAPSKPLSTDLGWARKTTMPASATVANVIASVRKDSRKIVIAVAPFVSVRTLGAAPVLPCEGDHNSAVFPDYERSAIPAIFRDLIGCDYGWLRDAHRCTRLFVAWRAFVRGRRTHKC